MGDENKMNFKDVIKGIWFSEESFKNVFEGLNIHFGVISFIINCLILVIPTNQESLLHLHTNFIVAASGFLVVNILVYFISCLLNMKFLKFGKFFASMNFFFMVSLLFISVPAFLLAHWVLDVVFNISNFAMILFIMIPYYNLVLYGWLAEMASKKKGFWGVVMALLAITLMLLYQNLLAVWTI